ncbi:DUF4012 domain-containing protein [Sinomonas atrocyanea]|uniref:DUF4012 domain-containing protein n=1 Tax=Sinomonas atrocyanea TaxID=37927 RepID=UPI003D954AF0
MGDLRRDGRARRRARRSRRPWRFRRAWALAALLAAVVVCGAVVAAQALSTRDELTRVAALAPVLKGQAEDGRFDDARATVREIQQHAAAARGSSSSPLWALAEALPWAGPNLRAAREVSVAADGLASSALPALMDAASAVGPSLLAPPGGQRDLSALAGAAPRLAEAADAVDAAASRLQGIDDSAVLPQLREPLAEGRKQLGAVERAVQTAEAMARIGPGMLGSDGPRRYLVLIQNNAETRAGGGIPGALVELVAERGAVSVAAQGSAGGLGVFAPPIAVDPVQTRIYSSRLGRFMQDVTLTPDFPTAAATAAAMWEASTGRKVDGVASLDPVALAQLLRAWGPVDLSGPEFSRFRGDGLPTSLTSDNAVRTLLSDIYRIESPKEQDVYFAAVARKVFDAFSARQPKEKALLSAVETVVGDGRVLLYSTHSEEQAALSEWNISGTVAGPEQGDARFGAYFNDGTGAKMDYYVRRTVSVVRTCDSQGSRAVLRISLRNDAPADAAHSLPAYVTGNGVFGIPPGTVQTNVVAYGPAGAYVENAVIDGAPGGMASDRHAGRPVGVLTVRLAPGQSTQLEFRFSGVPDEPTRIDASPGVQPRADVVQNGSGTECTPSAR